jgi:UDP-N-acetyl-D-glucosamine dehydrogenase
MLEKNKSGKDSRAEQVIPLALKALRERITERRCHIGIYGLGYVGLPLALRFAEMGLKVTGFDVDQRKVDMLNAGESYIERITPSQIHAASEAQFVASSDFSKTADVDMQIICVPTPLDSHHQPDLSFVTDTVDSIMPYFRTGQIMSLESTTWPGTTEELLEPRLRAKGFIPGENCALVYSPEREDPGNAHFKTADIPKVIGGSTPLCLELGVAVYKLAITTMVPVSSTKVAEMSKLLENIHRAVNIGLVNEMKIVADKMGINIHEVIQAASTKPFGFVPYTPGPGLGGHCIPIDPFYLTWKAKEYGINTRFIELAGEINHYMPHWVVQKVADALNEHGKAVKGSRILVLGLAYKKNIDDTRESPAVEIMALLQDKGAIVEYSDPHVKIFPQKREYSFDLKSVTLTADVVAAYDCLVLATDHDAFDYELIIRTATLVVDTRGRMPASDKLVGA